MFNVLYSIPKGLTLHRTRNGRDTQGTINNARVELHYSHILVPYYFVHFGFCSYAPTESQSFGWFLCCLLSFYKKNTWDSLFAHPSCPGLRIAPNRRDGQCRKPTYGIYHSHTRAAAHAPVARTRQLTAGYNIPTVSIHHCLILLRFGLKLRS